MRFKRRTRLPSTGIFANQYEQSIAVDQVLTKRQRRAFAGSQERESLGKTWM